MERPTPSKPLTCDEPSYFYHTCKIKAHVPPSANRPMHHSSLLTRNALVPVLAILFVQQYSVDILSTGPGSWIPCYTETTHLPRTPSRRLSSPSQQKGLEVVCSYSMGPKKRVASSSSGSPLEKSQPTMVDVWLQQIMRRASNWSLKTRGLESVEAI